MSKAIKVKWFNKSSNLNEIYQRTQIQFAFMSAPKEGSAQCHPFVLCRDFLHDAGRCAWLKTNCNIYGFKFRYNKNPKLDLKRTRMLVTKKTLKKDDEIANFHKRMITALNLLNHYEKMAGWTKTKLYRVKDDVQKAWLFNGTGMWMKSPFLISMYSFLIRLGDKFDTLTGFKNNSDLKKRFKTVSRLENKGRDNDIGYIAYSWDKMDKIIKNYNELFFAGGRPDVVFSTKETGIFHDYSGILSLCRNQTPSDALNKLTKELFK